MPNWLLRKPPAEVVDGSVQLTRRWMAAHKKAASNCRNKRSSVRVLMETIDRMRDIEAMRAPVELPEQIG